MNRSIKAIYKLIVTRLKNLNCIMSILFTNALVVPFPLKRFEKYKSLCTQYMTIYHVRKTKLSCEKL